MTTRWWGASGSVFLAGAVGAIAFVATGSARAEPSCSLAQIGQACAGGVTTCVQATCSTPQADGGLASVECGVCTYVDGVYCLPANVGQACAGGGVCGAGPESGSSGGGGGGGFTSYDVTTCADPVDASVSGSSSGDLGPPCPAEDDGKPCDGGGVCTIYSGSSGSSGGAGSGSSGSSSGAGSSSSGSSSGAGSSSSSGSGDPAALASCVMSGSSSSGSGSASGGTLTGSSGSSGSTGSSSSSGASGGSSDSSSSSGSSAASSGSGGSASGGSASGSGGGRVGATSGDASATEDEASGTGDGSSGCTVAASPPGRGRVAWIALMGLMGMAVAARRRHIGAHAPFAAKSR